MRHNISGSSSCAPAPLSLAFSEGVLVWKREIGGKNNVFFTVERREWESQICMDINIRIIRKGMSIQQPSKIKLWLKLWIIWLWILLFLSSHRRCRLRLNPYHAFLYPFFVCLSRLKFMGNDLWVVRVLLRMAVESRGLRRKPRWALDPTAAPRRWIKKCSISHYTHIIFPRVSRKETSERDMWGRAKNLGFLYFSTSNFPSRSSSSRSFISSVVNVMKYWSEWERDT